MHPILMQRKRLALYLLAWVPITLLLVGLLVFSGHFPWIESAILAAPMTLVYAFLCLSGWYLCRTFPVERTGLLRLLGIYGIAASLSSYLWVLLGKAWVLGLVAVSAFPELDGRYSVQTPLLFVVGALLYSLAVAIHYLMSIFETSREAEKRSLELKVMAREAELRALKAQIDPHFLFNSLNSISALTTIDPAGSRTMCQLLADFLRSSLDLGSKDLITLDEELSLAHGYLAIERVRLGPRLKVSEEIQDSSRECLVPPLLLQPLIENAVRHGVSRLVEGGEICLEVGRKGSRLSIRVENPCDSEQPLARADGIGLANIRSRLDTLYGAEARLELQKSDTRFRVMVSLPAKEKGDWERP